LENEISTFLKSLAAYQTYSGSTRAAYGSDLKIFVEYLKQHLQRSPLVTDFNSAEITNFFIAEKQEGRQSSTLMRRRAALLRFEKHLLTEGLLEKSQFGEGNLVLGQAGGIGELRGHPLHLDDQEIKQLFSLLEDSHRPLNQRDRAILHLLLEMGLSVSTLIAVSLEDVDLSRGEIQLPDHQGLKHWLPLGVAASAVECYIKQARPELNPSPDETALFISQNGIRMSRQSIWMVLRHWGKAAGLEMPLSPRMLRHTAALRLARGGRNISEIQVLLGHRNPLSTQALLKRLNTLQPNL
jgi:integrase/recombinase XerD